MLEFFFFCPGAFFPSPTSSPQRKQRAGGVRDRHVTYAAQTHHTSMYTRVHLVNISELGLVSRRAKELHRQAVEEGLVVVRVYACRPHVLTHTQARTHHTTGLTTGVIAHGDTQARTLGS